MATTRKKIREQIQLSYNQYVDKNGFDDEIDVRIIDLQVEQSINKFLKAQVQQGFKQGSIEVPTCNLFQYTLTASANAVTLPIYPLQLPLDMGVWRVILPSGSDSIPINTTMDSVYTGTNVSYIEGQIGHTIRGLQMKFTGTVVGNVNVHLLVSDFASIGLDTILPIAPEVEADVITDVLDRISQGRISQPELNVKQDAN